MLPTRDHALEILTSHVKDNYQLLHSQMVANAMEFYAPENEKEMYYITGLLHDVDYYEYPKEHPAKSLEWFKEWNYPEQLIHAVEAHARGYNGFEVEPKTRMAACLMACDEMSGFIYAYMLMRPEGLNGMEAKGVKKRLKDKAFAAKINREEISYAIEKFGIDIDEHIKNLIEVFEKMQIKKA